ncbi:MAG TPA: sugar ABC transporter permease [Candidatus Levilactobacillus faecigallinarum]|uniref:Sugar ABC transporter permease n=1 Tax=Candidatus Levilactobacillus faecigallinarum TaxID=2838638 RepID=A0A9D1QSG8_9LACO|nr:sugar ABC transporter permease [Candidatus Levilactobacillus faecigallinarum]
MQAEITPTHKPQSTPKVLTKTSDKGFNLHVNDKYYAALFLGPSLLILGVFVFYPMVRTLYLSLFLTDNVGRPTVFVGVKNYINLFTSSAYQASLWATLVYVVGVVALTLTLGLLLAQVTVNKLAGIQWFRTIFSATMGVSVSVAAIFWLFIFSPTVGLFDQIAAFLHLPVINWLTDPGWAMVSVTISTVWMNLGFTFLILFGALQMVPQPLYQAAAIEGASSRYQFFHVTLPMISPTLFFTSTVTLIGAFKSFGLIDLMTAGGPNNATNLMVYQVYRDAFLNGNYGLASAESIILAVIIALFTLLQFKFLEKRVNY